MIKIFIVTWVLANTVPTGCPDAGKTNEFGQTSMMNCAVFHSRTERENKFREFADRDSAFVFFDRAKGMGGGWSLSRVEDVKIDSVMR